MITTLERRTAGARARVVRTAGSVAAVSVLLAACGGAATGGNSTSASATKSPLSAIKVGGLSVLSDAARLPLYSPAQEASGRVLCTGACAKVWKPVAAGNFASTANKVAGKLGVVKRPDGTVQLTENSRPLYTFIGDSPGQLHGNGLTDQFNGHLFTWHAVLSSGMAASASANSATAGTSKSYAPATSTYGY